ncbi:Subtilisin-like protease SBT1.5 [Bienertia sinuspersici]
MSFDYSLVFLALFFSLTYNTLGENHLHNDQGLQTYIVSIQNNLKPSNFVNVEEWYKFILSKANSNPNDSMLHVYKTVFHGFSARLRPDQANSLKTQVEVIRIFKEQIYQLQTTRSPYFLGLNTYHKPLGLLKDSDMGSNVVVGVIDTGIWPENPSFSDEGMGPVPAHFKGVCDGGENFPPTLCNKKIVGVRHISTHIAPHEIKSARDEIGHGTHTASTIAGRTRARNSSFFGYAKGEATGIAPMARLSIYKVCGWMGCSGSDVLSGLDKAVEDGVDVISISLGGAERRYSEDEISIGAFGALQKGVIVSAAAGNSGPQTASLSNDAPWITTVAASTIDRTFPADVVLDNGVVLKGTSLYTGAPLPKNKTFPLVRFESDLSMKYCMPGSLKKKDVKGKIVICGPAMGGRVEKGVEVERAGGVGVIVGLDDPSIPDDTLKSDPFLYPGLTLCFATTRKLLKYIDKKQVKECTLVFEGTHIGDQPAPVVAPFSSRGPNTKSKYVLKPDVMAPGVNILAGWPTNLSPSSLDVDPRRSEFNILTGTSMACPHVSGVFALLKGAHPDWTPAMVRSALITTAYTGFHKMANTTKTNTENQEMSFYDTGAGHVDPEKANNPGLVLDISEDDYIQFLCASKYNDTERKTIVKRSVRCDDKKGVKMWDLNYPAIILTPELEGQDIVRSLTSVETDESSYRAKVTSPKGTRVTVSPLELSFKNKGDKQNFYVKVRSLKDNQEGSMKSKAKGSIIWTDGKRNVTIPLMVA